MLPRYNSGASLLARPTPCSNAGLGLFVPSPCSPPVRPLSKRQNTVNAECRSFLQAKVSHKQFVAPLIILTIKGLSQNQASHQKNCHFPNVRATTPTNPFFYQYHTQLFPLSSKQLRLLDVLSTMWLVPCRDHVELPSKLSGTDEMTVGVDWSEVTEVSRGSLHDVLPQVPFQSTALRSYFC